MTSQANRLDLCLVMPVYNESECIVDVLEAWAAMLEGLDIDFKMIILNDGSTDSTAETLTAYDNHSRIQIINKVNGGHGPTILMGYRQAVTEANWVFQVDSDNEMGPEHFHKLWGKRSKYDALFGYRDLRRQNAGRKFISICSRCIVKLLFGTGVQDVNTPYRLIRSDILKRAIATIPDDTFAPNVIVSGALNLSGRDIFNMPVAHKHRTTGTVSIVKWKLWKAAFRAACQTLLFRLRMDTKFLQGIVEET